MNSTRQIGERWYHERKSCVLVVPSRIIPREKIYIINPDHDDFTRVVAGPPESIDHIADGVEDLRRMMAHKQVFICHASEDKAAIARPLYNHLTLEGISCWLDEAEIGWGDSITEKVNEGLRNSRYVIVILSLNFLSKSWARRELNAALNKESAGGTKIVLPLVSGSAQDRSRIADELFLQSDKRYLEWTGDPEPVAEALKALLHQ